MKNNDRRYDAYRRPEDRQQPYGAQDAYGYDDAYGYRNDQGAPYNDVYGDPAYGQQSYGNQAGGYDVQPYDGNSGYDDPNGAPTYEELYGPDPDDPPPQFDEAWLDQPDKFEPQVIATNSTVRLTCTLASMMGLFGLFLCFAEKKSNAIRHFARQSAGLMIAHLVCGLILFLIGTLLGTIPLMGFLIHLVCWLCYIAVFITMVCMKVRMMLFAWRGWRFTLPIISKKLEKMD